MQRMLPILLFTWILVQATGLPACTACTLEAALHRSDHLQSNQGCSVLYATDGELALGGNNEDYINPLTKVWFIPGEGGSFGRVYFGFADYHAQGGMNDQGLFFDGLGLDETFPVSKGGKQEYAGNLVDTFDVAVSGQAWSTGAPTTIGPLVAAASAHMAVTVCIPASAADGESDAIIISITSRRDETKQAMVTLTTTAQSAVPLPYKLFLPLVIKPPAG